MADAILTINGQQTNALGAMTLTGQQLGAAPAFTNLIINGDFRFWQRGTTTPASFPVNGTVDVWTADRWVCRGSSITSTVSQYPFPAGEQHGQLVCNSAFQIAITANADAAGHYSFIQQRMENVNNLSGRKATVSMWVNNSAASFVALEFQQNFGVSGSATVTVAPQKIAVGPGWKLITATFDIPTVAGKTIGINSYITLNVWFSAGTTFNSRTGSLGAQTGTFQLSQVQVQDGAVATPFEWRPPGVEFAMCQRYYWQWLPDAPAGAMFPTMGFAYTASQFIIPVLYPVQMSKTPNAINMIPGSTPRVLQPGGTTIVCTVGTCYGGQQAGVINLAPASGVFVVGSPGYLRIDAPGAWFIDGEL